MRSSYLLAGTAAIVLLSACGSQGKSAMDADLRKDLELASSSDGISLGNGAVTASQQFVSSIERATPPARAVAKSAPVKRYKAARKAAPQVAQTEAPAEASAPEPRMVASMPIAGEIPAPVSARPQAIPVSYPGGASSGGSEGGSSAGGIFGAIIRGGVVDGDHCERHRNGRSRGSVISINNRIPVSVGRVGGRVSIGRSNGNIASRFPH